MQNPTRRNGLPRRKRGFPRAVTVHRSGNAESHAQDRSIAQKLHFFTRWSGPSRRIHAFSRTGIVHRSGITESHALERSTAREMQNLTRRIGPPLRNYTFPRAGIVRHSLQVLLRSFAKRGSDFINLELGFRQYGVDCFDK